MTTKSDCSYAAAMNPIGFQPPPKAGKGKRKLPYRFQRKHNLLTS